MSADDLTTFITDMEAAGQRALAASALLPKEAPWDELTALGFVRGEDQDDLFCKAELPEGWTKEASDHAMWSYLIDPRGIRMVGVFYKAAFYDRRAQMHIENVGRSAFTQAIYGNAPIALPPHWDQFTQVEKADCVAQIADYEQKIAQHPTIYGDHAERLIEFTKLVSA